MKRKIIVATLVIIFVLLGLVGCINSKVVNASVWKESPINDGAYVGFKEPMDFDLRETITDADYVFSGTVISRNEYEIEWTDDVGEQWGPFYKSVIEVRINKEYHGQSPVQNDIIRVYLPYSLSTTFEDSFLIKDESEYVFITKALDEEFVESKAEKSPEDRFEQEKYADVYISDSCHYLMPIEDGVVFVYSDYFYWDKEVVKQIKASDSVMTDKVSSPYFLEIGWFVALDAKDFEDAFLNLFENPEKLPDADDIRRLYETGEIEQSSIQP